MKSALSVVGAPYTPVAVTSSAARKPRIIFLMTMLLPSSEFSIPFSDTRCMPMGVSPKKDSQVTMGEGVTGLSKRRAGFQEPGDARRVGQMTQGSGCTHPAVEVNRQQDHASSCGNGSCPS